MKAIVPPNSVPNNKFGVHILDTSDLELANKLVNGEDGEWGYITVVIRQDDLSLDKWSRIFNGFSDKKAYPFSANCNNSRW